MSFWPFCLKPYQVYSLLNVGPVSGQFFGSLNRLEQHPAKWKSLCDYGGVQEDGTLWVWGSKVAWWIAFLSRQSGSLVYPYSSDGYKSPIQVGDDTDWEEVACDPSGEILFCKKAEVWYSVGWNVSGIGGIGLHCYDDVCGGPQHYRATISASVESIVDVGTISVLNDGSLNCADFFCSTKPTASIHARYRDSDPLSTTFGVGPILDNEPGSGAQVECDWKGRIHSIAVTSGGGGYTSIPGVRIVAAEVDNSTGASASAKVTKMALVQVVGFTPQQPGFGYTQAVAVESHTGTEAMATIGNFGEIAGWTVTKLGDQTADYFDTSNLSVAIVGDGTGATATPVLGPSSVIEITPQPSDDCWTEKPTVEIYGGGGEGAEAEVVALTGTVLDKLRLVSGGSGYTQRSEELYGAGDHGSGVRVFVSVTPGVGEHFAENFKGADGTPVAGVVLSPSGIVEIEKTGSPGDYGADHRLGSTGEVLPFHFFKSLSGRRKVDAFMLGPGKKEVLLQKEVVAYTPEVAKSEPTLSAFVASSGGNGTGAQFLVTLGRYAASPRDWFVSSVSVQGITSGYVDGQTLGFTTAPGDVLVTTASAVIKTKQSTSPPQVTAEPTGSGAGGSLTVSLSQDQGTSRWYVDSVSVSSPGSGYSEGDLVDFDIVGGSGSPPSAVIHIPRTAPASVTASAQGGSGAVISATLTQITDYWTGVDYWAVASADVSAGGQNYPDETPVSFVVDGITEQVASAIALCRHDPPSLAASVSQSSGSGAVLQVALRETARSTDVGDRAAWVVDGITVTSPGSGYFANDAVLVSVTDGIKWYGTTSAKVSSVNATGGVTGVSVVDTAYYYKPSGVIEWVYIDGGGRYYATNGSIESVSVTAPGSLSSESGEIDRVEVLAPGRYYHDTGEEVPPEETTGQKTFKFSLPSTADGYEHPPAILIKDSGPLGDGDWYESDSPLSGPEVVRDYEDPNQPVRYLRYYSRPRLEGYNAGWIDEDVVTVTGPEYGGSATYKVVDGVPKLESFEAVMVAEVDLTEEWVPWWWKPNNQFWEPPSVLVWLPPWWDPFAPNPIPEGKRWKGRGQVKSVQRFEDYRSCGYESHAFQWKGPSIPQATRLYFKKPCDGDAAYAESLTPNQREGGAVGVGAISIIRQGSGYREEPHVYPMTNFWIEPISIGKSFDSIGLYGTTGIATEGGQLFWWGAGAANSQEQTAKPTPFCRGAFLDDETQDSLVPEVGASRGYFSQPDHGVYRAVFGGALSKGGFDRRFFPEFSPDSAYNGWPLRKSAHSLFPGQDRWSPLLYVPGQFGSGYDSPPEFKALPGGGPPVYEPSVSLTASLSFQDAHGAVVSGGGNYFDFSREAGGWSGVASQESPCLAVSYTEERRLPVGPSVLLHEPPYEPWQSLSCQVSETAHSIVDIVSHPWGEGDYLQPRGLTLSTDSKTSDVLDNRGDKIGYTITATESISGTPETDSHISYGEPPVVPAPSYWASDYDGKLMVPGTGGLLFVDGVLQSTDQKVVDAYGTIAAVCGGGTLLREGGTLVSGDTVVSPIRHLSAKVTNYGAKYDAPAFSEIDRPPGEPTFDVQFSGRLAGVGVVDGGSGYREPPTISGIQGASCTIAGPVDSITLKSGGSGYRYPPDVRFSRPGLPAEATASINSEGVVVGVTLKSGGRYRQSPPAVTFEPVTDVESISVTSAGGGLAEAPDVFIGGGGGDDAAATCSVWGGVAKVGVNSPGAGYEAAPKISFSGGGGSGAKATCLVWGGVGSIRLENGGSGFGQSPSVSLSGDGNYAEAACETWGTVSQIVIKNPGEGYTSPPYVLIVGSPLGVPAKAKAVVSNGAVTGITLTDPGGFYSSTPTVTITGGGGTGAKATCSLNGLGSVAGITVTSQGSGYSFEPTVTITGSLQGTDAVAQAVVSDGGIASVNVTLKGGMYASAPEVSFVGGGGTGASAECILDYAIRGVTVTAEGDQYTSPPTVSFKGGSGAAATAIMNYRVKEIAVDASGDLYTSSPSVVITGGGGFGASATVSLMDYRVKDVTLTNRGHHYAEPPTIMFLNKDGSVANGASATAVLGTAGSGAAATATINGSVIFVKSTDGKYDTAPQVTAVRVGESPPGATDAVLKAVVVGNVTSVGVSGSQPIYSPTSPLNPGVRRPPGVLLLGSPHNPTKLDGFPLQPVAGFSNSGSKCNVASVDQDGLGAISSVTVPDSLKQTLFYGKPMAVSSDSYWVDTQSYLEVGGCVVEEIENGPSRSGVCPISGNASSFEAFAGEASGYRVPVDVVAVTGAIERFWECDYYFPPGTVYLPVRYYGPDDQPEAFIEDETTGGSSVSFVPLDRDPPWWWHEYYIAWPRGATFGRLYDTAIFPPRDLPISLDILDRGESHTLRATLSAFGGKPLVWSSPATATAVVEGGVVVGIEVATPGKGYTVPPRVFLVGGGGSGAVAGPPVLGDIAGGEHEGVGTIVGIPVEQGGSGYTSPPTVVIVDFEKQAHRDAELQSAMTRQYDQGLVQLREWSVEYAAMKRAKPISLNRMPSVGPLPGAWGVGTVTAWNYYRFHPVCKPTGYVEAVWIRQGQDCRDTYPSDPAIVIRSLGAGQTDATAEAKVRVWSGVFSNNMAVPLLPDKETYL